MGEKRNVEINRYSLDSQPSNQRLDLLIFPFHILKEQTKSCVYNGLKAQSHNNRSLLPYGLRPYIFKQVHAGENDGDDVNILQNMKYSHNLEALAKAYIQRETGVERIKMFFEKDHTGKRNIELHYIQVTLAQVFILTFFFKYIPAAKFARSEFIREHQATVFRTRFEAIRRLQDHTFIKAGADAAAFSTKITLFSASFLFLSSWISLYRNKTSVLEYVVAAGITGGLARMSLGPKGLLGGSLVGGVLGSAVGLLGYLSLSAYGMTQEERHFEAIKSKLEIFRSIEGENGFKDRINQLLTEDTTLTLPTS